MPKFRIRMSQLLLCTIHQINQIDLPFQSGLRNIFSSIGVKSVGNFTSHSCIPLLIENSGVSSDILILAILYILIRVSTFFYRQPMTSERFSYNSGIFGI